MNNTDIDLDFSPGSNGEDQIKLHTGTDGKKYCVKTGGGGEWRGACILNTNRITNIFDLLTANDFNVANKHVIERLLRLTFEYFDGLGKARGGIKWNRNPLSRTRFSHRSKVEALRFTHTVLNLDSHHGIN